MQRTTNKLKPLTSPPVRCLKNFSSNSRQSSNAKALVPSTLETICSPSFTNSSWTIWDLPWSLRKLPTNKELSFSPRVTGIAKKKIYLEMESSIPKSMDLENLRMKTSKYLKHQAGLSQGVIQLTQTGYMEQQKQQAMPQHLGKVISIRGKLKQ